MYSEDYINTVINEQFDGDYFAFEDEVYTQGFHTTVWHYTTISDAILACAGRDIEPVCSEEVVTDEDIQEYLRYLDDCWTASIMRFV